MQAQPPRHPLAAVIGSAAFLAIGAVPATRADVLGPYLGAAVGQGRIDTGSLTAPAPAASTDIGSFRANHSAYKLVAGVRAIAIVGAEVEYLDLGHPSTSYSSPSFVGSANVKIRGGGAFGLVYLPVPVVSVYAKAGLARLEVTSNVTGILPGVGTCPVNNPSCAVVARRDSAINTSFAAGVGAQVKLGPLAVRAEYERFAAAGGTPGLASVGAFWMF